jgi:hypothetical protein
MTEIIQVGALNDKATGFRRVSAPARQSGGHIEQRVGADRTPGRSKKDLLMHVGGDYHSMAGRWNNGRQPREMMASMSSPGVQKTRLSVHRPMTYQ